MVCNYLKYIIILYNLTLKKLSDEISLLRRYLAIIFNSKSLRFGHVRFNYPRDIRSEIDFLMHSYTVTYSDSMCLIQP